MENKIPSKKRINIGNTAILVAMFGLMFLLWNEYEWYEAVTPYGTLVTFVALAVAFFAYVDIKDALKDKAFWLVAATGVLAFVNLILVSSNMGAILTAVDILMVLYLANKIRIPKRLFYHITGFVGFFFFYWTFDVKGYFKGYNTNYGGLVLITGFVFALIGLECWRSYLKSRGHEKIANGMLLFEVFMFAWGYNIIAWYRARCAFLGLIVFALLMIIPKSAWEKKWFYGLVTGCATIGSVIFSLAYIWLGKFSQSFSLRLFYKDAISGREAIWKELWGAFLEKPITGIGSAYEIKIDWLEGLFEVHSGLLDILFVHGVAVFVVVCALLIKRLWEMRQKAAASAPAKAVMAGAMAILASSFLENFFIVPPYCLCLCILLAVNNCETHDYLL